MAIVISAVAVFGIFAACFPLERWYRRRTYGPSRDPQVDATDSSTGTDPDTHPDSDTATDPDTHTEH